MKQPISRLGDSTMGHGCYPPQIILEGSMNVFVEKIGVARVGDKIQPHSCHHTHPSTAAFGSMTVFVNKRPVMRVTDRADCGSIMLTGAATVRAG